MQNGLRLEILKENEKTFGPCSCCGRMTKRVWGYIYEFDVAIAAYFVEWTPGHADRAANFDLIVGSWGEDVPAGGRKAISLEFRHLATGPAFRVGNASDRAFAKSSLVGEALDRDEVRRSQLLDRVFAMSDLVYLEDSRLSELR